MRGWHNLLRVLICSCCAVFSSQAVGSTEQATPLFCENFADATLNLNWLAFPGFSQDSLKPILEPGTPEGDLWAGRQTNQELGGFASLSYAGMADLADYSIEAWVFSIAVPPPGRAPLNGIAVRVDPANQRFYRLATHFDNERRLTFAYVGSDTNNYPVFLAEWGTEDVAGGIPQQSGWHKMRITCIGSKFWVYWDDMELPGCPISDDRIKSGFFGIYANYVGGAGIVETRVDAIRVTVMTQNSSREGTAGPGTPDEAPATNFEHPPQQ